jgi:very-short-patch-repair endonuclease
MDAFDTDERAFAAAAAGHGARPAAPRRATDDVAAFVLNARAGAVTALAGIGGDALRLLVDQSEPNGRRVLFLRPVGAPTAEALVEQIVEVLAETVRGLWPVWFGDLDFSSCRDDTLGRLAVAAMAHEAAGRIAGLSAAWLEPAAKLALAGRIPRVARLGSASELTQLVLAIAPPGLVLVSDVEFALAAGSDPSALVHALEWIARHAPVAVIAHFADLPASEPPFDRILYGACCVSAQVQEAAEPVPAAKPAPSAAWLAPWRGRPHPLSEVEQRLAKSLAADDELGALFGFNQTVDTVHGSRPRVDLLWAQGRLVVELDGYESHGGRAPFMYDRHRDYELALSGYTVLRLANDEIVQDYGKAIAKIRDLVRLCRTRLHTEDLK